MYNGDSSECIYSMKVKRTTESDFLKIKALLRLFGYEPTEQRLLYVKIGILCTVALLAMWHFSVSTSSSTSYGNYEEIKAAHPELEL